jgi:hypothetical protein
VTAKEQHSPTQPHDSKGKEKVQIEAIKQLSKMTSSGKPEASCQVAKAQGNNNVPYCWCCFTKGHAIADCTMTMYCLICNCNEHVKERCPKWQSEKPSAVTCGYAVEGMQFFQIPHVTSEQQKNDSQTAIIQVIDGALSIPNMISELERLILTRWSWKVEEIGTNIFRAIFPNKTELQCMVEWGVVQTKFLNAKLKIGERMIDNKVVKILPKIWVQFNDLPKENTLYCSLKRGI